VAKADKDNDQWRALRQALQDRPPLPQSTIDAVRRAADALRRFGPSAEDLLRMRQSTEQVRNWLEDKVARGVETGVTEPPATPATPLPNKIKAKAIANRKPGRPSKQAKAAIAAWGILNEKPPKEPLPTSETALATALHRRCGVKLGTARKHAPSVWAEWSAKRAK
jgi:hypothetical protein